MKKQKIRSSRKNNLSKKKNKKKDFSKTIDLCAIVWYNIPEKLSK